MFCCRSCLRIDKKVVPSFELEHVEEDSPQIHGRPAWTTEDCEPLQEHLSGSTLTNSGDRSRNNDGDPSCVNSRSSFDKRSMDSNCDPSQRILDAMLCCKSCLRVNKVKPMKCSNELEHVENDLLQIHSRPAWEGCYERCLQEHLKSMDNDYDPSQLRSSSCGIISDIDCLDSSCDSRELKAALSSVKDIGTATKHPRVMPSEDAMTNADRSQDNDVDLLHDDDPSDINGSSPLKRRPVDSNCDPPKLISNSSAEHDCDPPQLSVHIPSLSDIKIIKKQPQLPVDILLLTVEDYEFLACYQELKDPYRWWLNDYLGYVYFAADVDERQEEKVKVALMRCCRGGSLISVKNAVTALRPKAVISVGTCSGLNPEKTKLGDVVVSAKLTTYASKVVTSCQEQSTGMRSYASRRFLNVIKSCADGWQAPLRNPEARKVEIHRGEFLSGPEVVSAEWRRKELAELHPQATALEMEGEGLFAAAFDLQVEWLIVKGISDYADGSESMTKKWRLFASATAASVVANILSDPLVFKQWPHYNQVHVRLQIDCEAITGPGPQLGSTEMVLNPQEPHAVIPKVGVVPIISSHPQTVVTTSAQEGGKGIVMNTNEPQAKGMLLAPQESKSVNQEGAALPLNSNKPQAVSTTGFGGENNRNGGIPSTQDVMNCITNKFLQGTDQLTPDTFNGFIEYLVKVREVIIVDVKSGSLIITVKCSSLQILEKLWDDYRTGRVNEMVQKFLVTEEILKELGLTAVKLTTTILEKEYRACREYLLKHPDSSATKQRSRSKKKRFFKQLSTG